MIRTRADVMGNPLEKTKTVSIGVKLNFSFADRVSIENAQMTLLAFFLSDDLLSSKENYQNVKHKPNLSIRIYNVKFKKCGSV